MERVTAAHTIKMANERMKCSVVQSNSYTTDYKLQKSLSFVNNPQSNMRSKIDRAFADLGIVTKTNFEAIV